MNARLAGLLALVLLSITFHARAQDVLIVEAISQGFQDDVVAKLNGAGVTSVTTFDASSATPTLGDLQAVDVVMTISDSGGFADNAALGDVLADYVDGGGTLVMTVFTFYDPSIDLGIGGRLSTGGYLPFTQGNQSQGTPLTLVPVAPGDPLLAGVTSFNGGTNSFHNSGLSVEPGATLVAEWSNGEPLIGYLGNVVGLNFYPPSSDARADFWDVNTDGATLLFNAVNFGAGGTPPNGPNRPPFIATPVPTNATWAMLILVLLTLGLAGLHLRREG